MAKVRVCAYFMHETEKAAAEAIVGAAEMTDGFVSGEVEEADIEKLRKAGLIVQEKTAPRPMLESRIASWSPLAAARRARDVARIDAEAIPAKVDFYKVALAGPLLEGWRSALSQQGVDLLEADPAGAYKVRLDMNQLQPLRSLNFVEDLSWISPTQSAPVTVTHSVSPAAGLAPPSGAKMLTFDVRVHTPQDLPAVEQLIRGKGLAVSGRSSRKIRFFALEDAAELVDLAKLPEVDTIAEYIPPKLANDVARVLLAIDAPAGQNPATSIPQDGTGQVVAVADTGIDDQHPDFQGRIVGTVALGRPNDATDPHGHGTHVAGSILGDGAASNGQVRGAAPKAQLFFQSLLDARGELGGLPLDLNDLFQEAYNAKARIHNNSWGSETPSTYTINSEEVDEFVWNHRDMLIVIAAGNAGTAAQPFRSAKGFVDWLSIGSPASCKNALTVGASRSSRKDGPMASMTWGAGWPQAFPDPPIAQEAISGDPDRLAAFSSRGPCDDYRIKPDVVAPGTDIASTRSSLAPIANFWGGYPATPGVPANPKYAFDGGTSMATPLVSGCAALVRQYYLELAPAHEPSAALVKATLINSTRWLGGPDSIAPAVGTPNYHQGHGRIAMDRAIPNASDPRFQLRFVDEWKNAGASFTQTGQRRRYQFTLGQGTPELCICLAYTDAPGRALQNNVNVLVHHVESATKWTGNSSLPNALTPLDTTNNVEVVRIPNPGAGNYFIQVVASNLLKPPQDFALVVTGRDVPVLTAI